MIQQEDQDGAQKIKITVDKLLKAKDGTGFPFNLIIDDPSGNSYIKNPYAPSSGIIKPIYINKLM